jgi:putative salt-induced outer membrane protein
MTRIFPLAVILALLPVAAFSQSAVAPAAADPWAGKVSLGYLATSGNTDTTTYNTAFEVTYSLVKWTHGLKAQANGSDDNGISTAEAYQASWKSTYDFTESNYAFGLVGWRKDRFSGVREQLTESVGYGRRILETPAHLLNAEIGVGHRDSDFSDMTSESTVIGTLGANYKWLWSETSNFEQLVAIEAGSDNTFLESISAVRARLLGELALVVSYTVRHNTDVPLGSQKTDTISAVSLEYAF